MADACINCGHQVFENLYEAPAFDLMPSKEEQYFGLGRCNSCLLVNTMRLAPDTVSEAYTSEYYGSPSSKFISIIERILAITTTARARKILRLWQQDRPTRKTPSVLDIGCGRGHLLGAFHKLGTKTLGLERSEFPLDEGTHDSVHVGSITDAEYASRKFDIIILWHVLEHLETQDTLLEEFARHQNKDGLLIIAVPNFSSFQQRLFSKHWFHLDLPRHLAHFDREWLELHLSKHGYSIEFESSIDVLQNTYGFIQSFMNVVFPRQRNAFYGLLKHGQYFTRKTMLSSLFWTSTLLVLAPLAILESVVSAIFDSGATIQIVARQKRQQ